MFKIGEHVIHPGQGVCTVTGFKDSPTPMIELEAHSGHSKTKLLYPVSQVDRLHACIDKDQAEIVALRLRFDSMRLVYRAQQLP